MNPKEEQTNTEVTNLDNESLVKAQKDTNYIDKICVFLLFYKTLIL